MEKELTTKISRFIELSNKFSKNLSDIFKDEEISYNNNGTYTLGYGTTGITTVNNSGTISISGNLVLNNNEVYVDKDGNVKSKVSKPITRADNIRAKAELRAILSDEFDEYCLLQNELGNFFSALNKLNK